MNRVTWSLVALAGACGGPPTPQPARLDPATAASITARLAGGRDRFCPGGAAPQLDVAVATTAGKVLDSWTQGEHRDGKLPFSTFEFTTSWGQIDGDGFVRLPDDPLAAIDRTVTVVVRVGERPDLSATVTLTPDFGCGGQLGAAGATGGGGRGGASGDRGADGRPDDGSRPAEAGQRGGHGGDGSPGGPGGPGPVVTASLGYLDLGGGRRLAILRVGAGGAADGAGCIDAAVAEMGANSASALLEAAGGAGAKADSGIERSGHRAGQACSQGAKSGGGAQASSGGGAAVGCGAGSADGGADGSAPGHKGPGASGADTGDRTGGGARRQLRGAGDEPRGNPRAEDGESHQCEGAEDNREGLFDRHIVRRKRRAQCREHG